MSTPPVVPPNDLRKKKKTLVKTDGTSYTFTSNFTQANYPGDLNTTVAEERQTPAIEIPRVGDHERISLPQITDTEKMLADLLDRGIRTTREAVRVDSLYPTQSEFNETKVLSLIASPSDAPIVISRDDFIVDGHHRWLASYNAGQKMINAIVINLNIRGCLDFLNGKPYTAQKSIEESFSVNLVLSLLSNFGSFKKAVDQGEKIYRSELKDKDNQIARIARMHGVSPREFMDLIIARLDENELREFLEIVAEEEKPVNQPFRIPGESLTGMFVEENGERFLITYTEKKK